MVCVDNPPIQRFSDSSRLGGGDGGSDSDLGFTEESSESDLNFDESDEDGDEADSGAAGSQSSRPANVEQWTCDDVAAWLRSLDLFPDVDELVASFAADEIDGSALAMLDKADVVRLGIVKIGFQKKFFKAVQALKK